jgi:hypothetical protein
VATEGTTPAGRPALPEAPTSEESRDAFFQDHDAVFDPGGSSFLVEELQRFFHRLMREAERAVVHGNHPARLEIQKRLGGVGGIGVNVAKLRGVVGANGKQSEFRCQAAPDFAEAVEIRGVPRVIHRMSAGFEDEASISAMGIFKNTGAPVTRGNVGDGKIAVAGGFPPVELDDLGEAQIRHQVGDVSGNDDGGSNSPCAQIIVNDRAQRGAMQVIKVSVRDKYQIDRGKISNAQTGPTQALQDKQPPGEVGIDDNVSAPYLDKEAGMSNERDAEFAIGDQTGFVSLTETRGDRRVTHQTSKLRGAFTKGRIAESLFDHPSTEPRVEAARWFSLRALD